MITSADVILRSDKTQVLDALFTLAHDECVYYSNYEVATGTTDGAISLGPVTTATVVYVKSDQTVTVKHNASATAITITANGFILLFNTSVTALTVTNASGSTANMKIYFAGN